MKRDLIAKIFAVISLLGIVIGILGTAIIYILTPKESMDVNNLTSSGQEVKLNDAQLKELQSITAGDGSGIVTGTGN
ncbi:MAG: hypothetical protein PHN31_01355 [Candidatus Gracilibacteria bacterium]|nr:hypothetical protein [Candidatus Gracilibacteria bacterium]